MLVLPCKCLSGNLKAPTRKKIKFIKFFDWVLFENVKTEFRLIRKHLYFACLSSFYLFYIMWSHICELYHLSLLEQEDRLISIFIIFSNNIIENWITKVSIDFIKSLAVIVFFCLGLVLYYYNVLYCFDKHKYASHFIENQQNQFLKRKW